MFKHREARRERIDQIFMGKILLMDEDIEGAMGKLEKTLLKENRIWWDVVTLERYMADGIVPRGLRIKKICSFKPKSANFTKEWLNILDICSLSLIELILKERRQELKDLECEIEDLKSLISPFAEIQEVKEIEERIRYRVQKKEQGITEKKYKKYRRDKADYSAGIQYAKLEKSTMKKEKGEKPKGLILGKLEEVENYLRKEEERIERRILEITDGKSDLEELEQDDRRSQTMEVILEKKKGKDKRKKKGEERENKVKEDYNKDKESGKRREESNRVEKHHGMERHDRRDSRDREEGLRNDNNEKGEGYYNRGNGNRRNDYLDRIHQGEPRSNNSHQIKGYRKEDLYFKNKEETKYKWRKNDDYYRNEHQDRQQGRSYHNRGYDNDRQYSGRQYEGERNDWKRDTGYVQKDQRYREQGYDNNFNHTERRRYEEGSYRIGDNGIRYEDNWPPLRRNDTYARILSKEGSFL